MKKIILILIVIAAITSLAYGHNHLNAGLGYYGENFVNPGFVLEFEYEKMHTEDFSLPFSSFPFTRFSFHPLFNLVVLVTDR